MSDSLFSLSRALSTLSVLDSTNFVLYVLERNIRECVESLDPQYSTNRGGSGSCQDIDLKAFSFPPPAAHRSPSTLLVY
jgi:hypothetical protein